jgi:hypothetical protein
VAAVTQRNMLYCNVIVLIRHDIDSARASANMYREGCRMMLTALMRLFTCVSKERTTG